MRHACMAVHENRREFTLGSSGTALKCLRPDRQPGPGYMPMLGMTQLHGIGPWSNLKENNTGRGFLLCRLTS